MNDENNNKSDKDIDNLIEMIEDKIDNASLENQQLFGQLKENYQTALAENNPTQLLNIAKKLQEIFINLEHKNIMKILFNEIVTKGVFVNQQDADDLISQGNRAIQDDNFNELEQILGQLIRILTPESQNEIIGKTEPIQHEVAPSKPAQPEVIFKAPFPAYKGDENYIFVSYAHSDAKKIYPDLIQFQKEGFNIWYNQGIDEDTNWPEEIEKALLNCTVFIVFISPNAIESENVRNEIDLAIDEHKKVIPIYLEETELKYGLNLRLANKQGIFRYAMSEEKYIQRLKAMLKKHGFENIQKIIKSNKQFNDIKLSIKEDINQKTVNNNTSLDNKSTGCGIYLGDDYSCIAKVDGKNIEVIQNILDGKNYLSSAVYVDKKGRLFVGDKARRKIGTDPKNAYTGFISKMGTNHVYTFENTGKQMTPIELSAEILKELRRSVKTLNNKDLKAAVITIPADFSIPQNNATMEATKLAGFEQVVLLQEPTATAMAYGFNSSAEDEIWLIYDLGGGSFNVSIMMKNEGEIVNKINQGDNRLGGKLINEDIVDKILAIAISQELKLTDFNRNNTKYRKQFAKLKRVAEQAKKDLSHHETTEIMIDNFMITSDGDAYDFEYEMNREELNSIMKPYVDRTINHCNKAMEGANLSPEDISKIILVGGSTLTPYIRERLTEEYHIALEYSINPTTVKAEGAAMYSKFINIDNLIEMIEDRIEDVSPENQQLFIQLKENYQTALAENNPTLLENIENELRKIFMNLEHINIMKILFNEIVTKGVFVNQQDADDLISRGNMAAQTGNINELEQILGQLIRILTPESQDEIFGRKEPMTKGMFKEPVSVKVKNKKRKFWKFF